MWCVPFSGALGFFNKNYKSKKNHVIMLFGCLSVPGLTASEAPTSDPGFFCFVFPSSASAAAGPSVGTKDAPWLRRAGVTAVREVWAIQAVWVAKAESETVEWAGWEQILHTSIYRQNTAENTIDQQPRKRCAGISAHGAWSG